MNSRQLSVTRQFDIVLERLVCCPRCTRKSRFAPFSKHNPARTQSFKRYNSSWGSTSVVNGSTPTPTKYRPLHKALGEVRKRASAHVNLSRLQLAIQSLESPNPTIRLAVLGLNVPDTARRIVRLLLADALEDEGTWEKQITHGTQDFSRGLIIRYGHGENNSNIPRPKTSVPVLLVPSNVLSKNNLEILVSAVNGPNEDRTVQTQVQSPAEIFLSPTVGTPTSESGRQVMFAQPAHRCLLVAHGLDELVAAAELLATTKFSSSEDRDSVMAVVNLESIALSNPDRKTLAVNTKQAEEGLAAIRTSVLNATEYEHKWIDSGMPALSTWLTRATATQSSEKGHLAEPVRDLISSLLTAATRNLQASTVELSRMSVQRSMASATRARLEEAIDRFSRSAHQELQAGLASAWMSRNWRKLAWYKLFWRVDDVGLIVTDLISNAWLLKTEKAVYELSGRLVQVGINPVTETAPPPPVLASQAFEQGSKPESNPLQLDAQLATAVIDTQPTQSVIVNRTGISNVKIEPIPQPIPIASSISRARSAYMSDAITSLTTTAQQLVFRTLSIVGLSAGLSSLTYASVFSSIYEAGTITAIGTVFALWTMQSGWHKSTKHLEQGLFDEGRLVIVDVVDRMKVLVDRKSQVHEDLVEMEAISEAENAIVRAKAELNKLEVEAHAAQ